MEAGWRDVSASQGLWTNRELDRTGRTLPRRFGRGHSPVDLPPQNPGAQSCESTGVGRARPPGCGLLSWQPWEARTRSESQALCKGRHPCGPSEGKGACKLLVPELSCFGPERDVCWHDAHRARGPRGRPPSWPGDPRQSSTSPALHVPPPERLRDAAPAGALGMQSGERGAGSHETSVCALKNAVRL